MSEGVKSDLTYRLLMDATAYVEENKHIFVKPFHLLLEMIKDPEAKVFLENAGFPFERMKEAVLESEEQFDTLTRMMYDMPGKSGPAHFPKETIAVAQTASQIAADLGRDWPGYLELISAIMEHPVGNDPSMSVLRYKAQISKDLIADCLKDESAVWSPDLEIIPSTKKRFDNAVNDNSKVLAVPERLKSKVFDQDEAIDVLARGLRRSKAGLTRGNKPVGSFLFAGPTGVGKTEVAKQLAEIFGLELIRFDMSEFQEKHTAARLVGAPPGYVGYDKGGEMTEKVEAHPHCVLLLDEIEKAHPDVYNMLLQVMDAGRLTDGQGKTVDFKNVILVMSSNVGAFEASKDTPGFATSKHAQQHDHDEAYKSAIQQKFTPEFRNRLTSVVVFGSLSPATIKRVAKKFVDEMNEMDGPQEHNIKIIASDAAIEALVEKGYDEKMGARPMERLVDRVVSNQLADMILIDGLKDAQVEIDYDAQTDQFSLETTPIAPRPVTPEKPKREMVARGGGTSGGGKVHKAGMPGGGGDGAPRMSANGSSGPSFDM